MGKNRHRNRNKKNSTNTDKKLTSSNSEGGWPERNKSGKKHYQNLIKENVLFDKYYKGLGLVPDEEWNDFHKTLTEPLPVTFRINGNRSQAIQMLEIIQGQYLKTLTEEEIDGEVLKPPNNISWYPDNLAWHMDVSRQAMRKAVTYSKFHKFLVAETESGNISRQEAVSMIPPLLLNVEPQHKVLDMCAAPGSKTAQLIELLHSDEKQRVPEGFVVANDADNKRCYLMVHQVKRLLSPNCMIVNHDASILPRFRMNPDKEGEKPLFYQFDRILADVPCSGDGTLRKNPDLWKKWNPTHACGLHGLQKKILQRGLELLSEGGRLVYSTCSFHPVEDEAVVAHLLKKCQGSVELVDVKDILPELKHVKGLTTWKVMSKEGTWYEKYEDIPQSLASQIKDTMFPPTAEEQTNMHLNRCIRILPHHQNTGGFFIAVFKKTSNLPWLKSNTSESIPKPTEPESIPKPSEPVIEKKSEEKVDNNVNTVQNKEGIESDNKTDQTDEEKKRKSDDAAKEKPAKKPRLHGYKEDPFLFMSSEDSIWPSIKQFYSLPDDFPLDQSMYRSEEGSKRSLYFVSKGIKNIVECNRERLKFINMGVKMFSRAPSPLVPACDFRVAQECLATIHTQFTGRHVDITPEDACKILTEENPLISSLSEESANLLNAVNPGSIIFCYRPTNSESRPQCEIVFCGWRGKVSVRSFVGEHERQHNLMLFGMELDEINKKVEQLKAERKALNKKNQQSVEQESDAT